MLVRTQNNTKFGEPEFESQPCCITATYVNGTVLIKKRCDTPLLSGRASLTLNEQSSLQLKPHRCSWFFDTDFHVNTTKFVADWDYIWQCKQNQINANNVRENTRHILHTYHTGDKVLVKSKQNTKYGSSAFEPYPCRITCINASWYRAKQEATLLQCCKHQAE